MTTIPSGRSTIVSGMTSAATLSHETLISNLQKTSRFLFFTFRPQYQHFEPALFGFLDLSTKKIYGLQSIFFTDFVGFLEGPDNIRAREWEEGILENDYHFFKILPVSTPTSTKTACPSSSFSSDALSRRILTYMDWCFVNIFNSYDIKVFLGFLLTGNLVSQPLPSLPPPLPSRPSAPNHMGSIPRNNTVAFEELDWETRLELVFIFSNKIKQ